jgi:PAS domain S-box-containing protein
MTNISSDERHRIGKALMESEERYRRLVELSPDAIVVHRNGRFIYVNPGAVQLWGASNAQDLIGKSILDVVHPDYHDHVRERVDYIQRFLAATPLAEQKWDRDRRRSYRLAFHFRRQGRCARSLQRRYREEAGA